MTLARSKTRSSRKTRSSQKTRKPRRISFRRFSTPSFPFCTISKTENSEMKTSECCFKPFYQTPRFPFCTIPKTENSEMKPRSALSSLFTKLRVFPTPSFPFCTIPKMENSELETSEFSLRFTRTAIFFNYLIKL